LKKKPALANSLSRTNKLTKKSEFLRLREGAKKFVTKHWIVFYRENGLDTPRLAISISGRFGNAVKRNRFRRLIKEAFREKKEEFKGFDLHFVAKKSKHATEQKIMEQEIRSDFFRFLRQRS